MTEQVGVPAPKRPPAGFRVAPYRQVTLQLLRFGLTGAFVFGIYAGGTLLLSGPLGLPIVLAIGLAFSLALAVNFTMQRRFVFLDHDTFALRARTQFTRYIIAAACNYALTSLIVTTVPQALGVSQQLVFVVTALVMSLVGFSVVRWWIFHVPR
jgi:putative flippase GtrA